MVRAFGQGTSNMNKTPPFGSPQPKQRDIAYSDVPDVPGDNLTRIFMF